jgi:hypothetical protein
MAILTNSLKVFARTRFSRSLELDIKSATETVSLLGVAIRMITRILSQVIESLCILHDSASPLSQNQKFIQLSLNQSLRNRAPHVRAPPAPGVP